MTVRQLTRILKIFSNMDLREVNKAAFGRHPWELARVAALRQIMKISGITADLPGTPNVLDVGCGDAYTIGQLCSDFTASQIDGVDVYLEDQALADIQHENPHIKFHNSYDTLSRNNYDLLTMFDVLEHVEDDRAFLKDLLSRHTSVGSYMFVTVPAFNSLFSCHDKFLQHYRRYSHRQLLELLEGVDCEVINSGYLFLALLPIRLLSVFLERLGVGGCRDEGVGAWRYGSFITTCLKWGLMLDNIGSLFLNRIGIRLPGLTVWALCKR